MYLGIKYKNSCMSTLENVTISLNGNKTPKIKIPKNCKKYFNTCLKRQHVSYIIIPLMILNLDSSGFGHANILLYNKHEKSLERFEPYGPISDLDRILDTALKKKFKSLKISYEDYCSPVDYCPSINFQSLQTGEID